MATTETDYELELLYEKHEEQKNNNSKLQHLTLSNIRDIEGKRAYRDGNFHVAFKKFKESIDAVIENLKIVIEFSSEDRDDIITKSKEYMQDRAKRLISSYIIDNNLARQEKSVSQLKNHIRKTGILNFSGFQLGKKEIELAIEEGIVFTIIKYPESLEGVRDRFTLLDPSKVSMLPKSKKLAVQKGIYLNQLKSFDSSQTSSTIDEAKEKGAIHKALAKLYLNEGRENSTTLYYENTTDYLKYHCLSTNQIDVFWKRFDVLQESLDEYIAYEKNSSAAVRRCHLESAMTLVHGMGIAKSLTEKKDIARMITMHFSYAASYNAERFRVYWDWFKIADSCQRIHHLSPKKLKELISQASTLKSLSFIDRDPLYARTKLPEVVEIQKNIQIWHYFIQILDGEKPAEIADFPRTLKAALLLFTENWLDASSAFRILNKFIENELKINPSPEPLHLFGEMEEQQLSENQLLIQGGETNEIEFKETWRYDVRSHKSNTLVESDAIKNIAAFLNTNGGVLFIGVNDFGKVSDLYDTEAKLYDGKNFKDELRKQIDQKVSQDLSPRHASTLQIRFDQEDEKLFAVIKVPPSQSPVFMNQKFYIRRQASSIELQPSEMLVYVQEHFNNK